MTLGRLCASVCARARARARAPRLDTRTAATTSYQSIPKSIQPMTKADGNWPATGATPRYKYDYKRWHSSYLMALMDGWSGRPKRTGRPLTNTTPPDNESFGHDNTTRFYNNFYVGYIYATHDLWTTKSRPQQSASHLSEGPPFWKGFPIKKKAPWKKPRKKNPKQNPQTQRGEKRPKNPDEIGQKNLTPWGNLGAKKTLKSPKFRGKF